MIEQGMTLPLNLAEVQTYLTSPVASDGYRYCVIPVAIAVVDSTKQDFIARGWEWVWTLDDPATGQAKIKFRKKEEKKL